MKENQFDRSQRREGPESEACVCVRGGGCKKMHTEKFTQHLCSPNFVLVHTHFQTHYFCPVFT